MTESDRARELAPWDAFEELERFRAWNPLHGAARLGRVLESLFASGPAGSLLPLVEIREGAERYVVVVEVPGASRADVSVEVHARLLEIRGETRSEHVGTLRRVERRYGSFRRCFTLPPDADAERLEASVQDGVLTVELPKLEPPGPRRVSIQP